MNYILRTVDGKKEYYLHNDHGNVIQITDASGNVVNHYNYDVFGQPILEYVYFKWRKNITVFL